MGHILVTYLLFVGVFTFGFLMASLFAAGRE
jgi:hypothetical protein